ncbi:MAG: aldo/keto reductase [Candidatus Atribacteria bacterium]|nr:aldo/keto reductase [Candidatus Atribacteria bacterium]
MNRRKLGQTDLELSLMGLGGFHLVELLFEDAVRLVNRYLDLGGNYLETAESYGHGDSERKIGEVLKTRRRECVVATKSRSRTAKEVLQSIDGSLRRLQTNWIDLFFIHEFNRYEVLDEVSASDGALEGIEKAKKAGKIRYVAFSNHVTPEVAEKALELYPFDALMIPLNYFDRFNFPGWEERVIPLAQSKGAGILAMKVFADGFLWRNTEAALRYTLSLPVSCLVLGANTEEYLQKDMMLVEQLIPMSEEEKERWFFDAPELGQYVCRQCGKCLPCPQGIDIPRVFLLEGQYDRQMKDDLVRDPAEYALRDRLRFWFGNQDYAQKIYASLVPSALACNQCGECEPRCPYGLPIMRKLTIAHEKLTDHRPPGYTRIF